MNAENTNTAVKLSLYVGVALIAYFIVKKIFGLFSAETPSANTIKMLATGAVPSMDTMNTELLKEYMKEKNISSIADIDAPTALSLARGQQTSRNIDSDCGTIYNAKGTFKDNEDTVYSILRQYQTQYQFAQLFDAFPLATEEYEDENRDLVGYLWTFCDNTQMDTISGIIDIEHKPEFQYVSGKLPLA